MEIKALCDILNGKGRVAAVKKLIDGSGNAMIDGLAGSSAAMLFAALPQRSCPYLIVVNDLDEAGYMYNDLCQIVGDKRVLIFPSGYKRDIKYGQVDAPNEILRTEVLNRWFDDAEVRWVVTYPEALAERVRRREDVEASTVHLKTGGTADLTEIAARLRELGFTATDYVYEPGQFSVRGSILDVFSYSNELPYRIDFWGDDIDSIRTFNVETQLSEEHLEQVSILNNSPSGGGREDNVSLLDYVGDDTIVLCRSEQWLTARIGEIAKEGMSASALSADVRLLCAFIFIFCSDPPELAHRRTTSCAELDDILPLGKRHGLPANDLYRVRGLHTGNAAVDEKRHIAAAGEADNGCGRIGRFRHPLRAYMKHGLLRPVRLEEIEDVLLRCTVARDQSLVVDSVLAALAPSVRGEVEHRPDERTPEPWLSADRHVVRR